MRYAILSDIHANLEALTAVLDAVEEIRAEAVYCLGDIVGYGADPDACVRLTLARATLVVRGNHDKAVAGLMNLEWFNNSARAAALWTRKNAREETLAQVKGLPEGPRDGSEGILICHGTPFDEDTYLFDRETMMESFRTLDERHPGTRICFHGHTHVPFVAVRDGARDSPRVLRQQAEIDLEAGGTYLINPGSVGQPRDGNARASFGILDTDRMVYRNLRIAYGIREAQRKIHDAGIPEELARRLAEGR
jgi:predicted phosphodiesterase